MLPFSKMFDMAEDREDSSSLPEDISDIISSPSRSVDQSSDHDNVIIGPGRRDWTSEEELAVTKFIDTHRGRNSLYFTDKAVFFDRLGSVLAKISPREAERFNMLRLATKIGKMAAKVKAGGTERYVEHGPSFFTPKLSNEVSHCLVFSWIEPNGVSFARRTYLQRPEL